MRRAKWGIGAVVVVGIAWLLSNMFNIRFGGIGGDEGTSIGLPTDPPVAETREDDVPEKPPLQSEPIAPGETVSMEGSDEAVGSGGAVDVLIDGRTFSIRRGEGDKAAWVPAEPAVIASYAKQAPGDETGVRVRIFRRPSALASAEEELSESLRNVGIPASEIDLREQLLQQE